MKQHITSEQLKEVDTSKLIKCFSKRVENAYAYAIDKYGEESAQYALQERVTIGKMIEILSNIKQIEILQASKWWVMFADKSIKCSGNELCDALWEAVKEIL